MLKSSLCTERDLRSPEFARWLEKMHDVWNADGNGLVLNRKLWEWAYITQALFERNMLRPGARGLGFGVGRDPLTALFASLGCDIVATDIEVEEATRVGWVASGQHAARLEDLNMWQLCDPDVFAKRVTFRNVDMRDIPEDLRGFDFTWSACAFEHLGSLPAGEEFLRHSLATVRPKGVAVHTTEYNLGSNDETFSEGQTVLYRRQDIERLVGEFTSWGHGIELDLDPGSTPADLHVDQPPFTSGQPHLKLEIGPYVATSLGLIITKTSFSHAVMNRVRRAVKR